MEKFPSPPGTSYFLIGMDVNEVESIIRFPSPPGTSYFLMVTIITEKPEKMVSVPSGDFLFFNVMRECLVRFSHLFPSPPGTSYFLIPSLLSLDSSGSGKRFAAQTAKALLFLFLET